MSYYARNNVAIVRFSEEIRRDSWITEDPATRRLCDTPEDLTGFRSLGKHKEIRQLEISECPACRGDSYVENEGCFLCDCDVENHANFKAGLIP